MVCDKSMILLTILFADFTYGYCAKKIMQRAIVLPATKEDRRHDINNVLFVSCCWLPVVNGSVAGCWCS